eukprot:g2959.t1
MAISSKHILVTGGCGYIGSHTILELLKAGGKNTHVTVIDNICNSKLECLERVKMLSGRTDITLFEVDLCNRAALRKVFEESCRFDSVIHFAALKAVGESVKNPLLYYKNNILGTLNLLEMMVEFECKNIVFSSSATVYGTSPSPLSETSTVGVGITNPYGQTKCMMENVLRDVQRANPDWTVVLLRYFNPVGAHESGEIGEDPKGIPNNLMPYIQQVAVGRRTHLNVFGDDYHTPDGTGVRDYIHVVDLARGHVAALQWVDERDEGICEVFNLGTGKGISVLEMLHGMEKACGHKLSYKVVERRAGDLAEVYADPKKAKEILGWTAKFGSEEMCLSSWKWQNQNPNGFGGNFPGAETFLNGAKNGSSGRSFESFEKLVTLFTSQNQDEELKRKVLLLAKNESDDNIPRKVFVQAVDQLTANGCILNDNVKEAWK